MGNGFRELHVWQDAKRIAVEIYLLVRRSPLLQKDWGLRDQIQRGGVSIASNIAEGDARKSDKDSIRFFHIALGSAAKLITQLEIVHTLELSPAGEVDGLISQLETLSKQIGALILSRKEK